MRVMVTGRQGGKTTAMLEWMRGAPEGEHRVCVSASREQAMRLLRDNPDLESWQFVALDDVRRGGAFGGVLRGRGGHVVLGIDNLDMVLGALIYWPVDAVTVTGEAWVEPTISVV